MNAQQGTPIVERSGLFVKTGLLRRLVHDSNGPLTRELVLNPSLYGLPSRVDAHNADGVVT